MRTVPPNYVCRNFSTMPCCKRNFRILATLAALSLLALAASCRGFFVNPTLTSLAVAPASVSLIEGQTRQLSATGTYAADNSTKDLTGSVDWTTSDPTVATVSSGGLVKAAATLATPPGTATITATSGTITGTSTITVNTGPLLSIAVTASTLTPTARLDLHLDCEGNIFGKQPAPGHHQSGHLEQ